MIKIDNFIGGNFFPPNTGDYSIGQNPSTGKAFYHLASSNETDVNHAILEAKQAFALWSKVSSADRSCILNKLADLILKNSDIFAKYESQDSGKPYHLARTLDIPRSARNFSFFASAATQFSSECHPVNNESINYTLRQPLGVVVCISPWNLPLYLLTWKLAPALAAGNCVVAKPANITSASAYLLTQLIKESGLPNGVLNIVYGSGKKLGNILCTHSDVKAVSFTGGTETGVSIAKIIAPSFKKYSLELGGKNAAIIFSDCDLKKAVATTVKSSFTNQGQICLCTPRILIESSIYNKFKEEFIKLVSELKVGDPMDRNVDLGAVVSMEQRDKVLKHISNAKLSGGNILCGSDSPLTFSNQRLRNGSFLRPTVIENIPMNAGINQEEVFGPVVTLTPFSSTEEAVKMANQSDFGLAATIWTKDITRAHRLSSLIDAGIIWVNNWMIRDLRTPFGGMKKSGFGREGGQEAMRFFTETKNVCVYYNDGQ
jgi:aminomuconate-semialdehyde/2-hydroxymuconate-6-semialdehyde dehydrogenase